MIKKNFSILVVDDEQVVRETVKKILFDEGYEVFVAEDGKSAIEVARNEYFDAALLDIKLPDIDGIAVFERIKMFRPNVEAVIMTAFEIKELVNRAREMTLYTTLEPCLMCFGAIMLYGIGRLVFGSVDDFGGASSIFNHLPDFFDRQFQNMEWIGPAYTQACDPLYARLTEIEHIK